MDANTEKLIRELADKLGTTTEHLWGVLVRQAPITGTIELLVCGVWIAAIIWTGKFISKKTTPVLVNNRDYPKAEWADDVAMAAWFMWAVIGFIVMVAVGCSLAEIVGAIVNPEYWALKQLIR